MYGSRRLSLRSKSKAAMHHENRLKLTTMSEKHLPNTSPSLLVSTIPFPSSPPAVDWVTHQWVGVFRGPCILCTQGSCARTWSHLSLLARDFGELAQLQSRSFLADSNFSNYGEFENCFSTGSFSTICIDAEFTAWSVPRSTKYTSFPTSEQIQHHSADLSYIVAKWFCFFAATFRRNPKK